jgi:hypothetical protein
MAWKFLTKRKRDDLVCMTRGVKVKEYSKQFLSEHIIFEVEVVIQAEQFSVKITNTNIIKIF